MKKKVLLPLVFLCLAAFGYGLWLYLTDFYYKKPKYTFAIRNGTSEPFRNVVIRLFPEGGDDCGALEPGQAKHYMDPRWAVPAAVEVRFDDAQGVRQGRSVLAGRNKTFTGDFTVLIVSTNGSFDAVVQKTPAEH